MEYKSFQDQPGQPAGNPAQPEVNPQFTANQPGANPGAGNPQQPIPPMSDLKDVPIPVPAVQKPSLQIIVIPLLVYAGLFLLVLGMGVLTPTGSSIYDVAVVIMALLMMLGPVLLIVVLAIYLMKRSAWKKANRQ